MKLNPITYILFLLILSCNQNPPTVSNIISPCIENSDHDGNCDSDGDQILNFEDPCPYDFFNDGDGDGVCGCTLVDISDCPNQYDTCPGDVDIDEDGICDEEDNCLGVDDSDDDGICDDVDECPYDPENDNDNDGICGDVDECPYDSENDADGDGVCDNLLITFESGVFDEGWSFHGSNDWSITSTASSEGSYSAKSGYISHYQYSDMRRTIEVPSYTTITISFDRYISSESNYDYLRFYIDDVSYGYWSGNDYWSSYEYSYYTGSSTSIEIKWKYSKDGSVSSYNDCGYIDNIKIEY